MRFKKRIYQFFYTGFIFFKAGLILVRRLPANLKLELDKAKRDVLWDDVVKDWVDEDVKKPQAVVIMYGGIEVGGVPTSMRRETKLV